MNYDDELERSKARRSRRKTATSQSSRGASHSAGKTEDKWASLAEPGSRASRSRGSSSRRRKKPMGKGKKIAIGIGIAVLVLIVAAVIGVYAYLKPKFDQANNANEFDQEDVVNINLSEETREKMEKGYWTIAVFGLDSRDSSTGAGNQSDVIMIVNINRETGEIKLVSVFRDTYLNVNDKNTYNKINAAYAQGGPEQAVKALNKNLDLNITHYAAFNWKAVATAINILGGVDIDISKSEFYYINAFITETVKGTGIGSTQLKSAGLNHLDGVQAVAYGRLRLMDSDYARTERQRLVIQKAFEKAKKADLATLNSLAGNMFEMCATNIKFGDVAAMIPNVTKYSLGESMGFPAARSDQRIKIGSDNLSCVVPQTLESNVISLHKFLFDEENYTPTDQVLAISKKISDVSGLYNAGKEIDHVPTDKGYVPKATTAAATSAASTSSEKTDGSGSETSEGESGSGASEGESSSSESGESSSDHGMGAGGWESQATDPFGYALDPTRPSTGVNPYETSPVEPSRPQSPQDHTTEAYGPGYESRPEEATTSPGPAGSATQPSSQTSIIVVPRSTESGPSQTQPSANVPGGQTSPTAATSSITPTAPTAPTAAAPTASAPSSPADMTLPSGNMNGPASQAPGAGN